MMKNAAFPGCASRCYPQRAVEKCVKRFAYRAGIITRSIIEQSSPNKGVNFRFA
jgi:hypothetical protein